MKPIIGIIASRKYSKVNPFDSQTKFVDNFPKRVTEAGGVPLGILFPYGKFNEDVLKLCDGLIIQGGKVIESSHICTIHYAYINGIPLLGICLGMQAMAGYEWCLKNNKNVTYEIIEKNLKKESEHNYLYKKVGHNKLNPFDIGKIDMSKHKVKLKKSSKLYKIYGKEILNTPSLHNNVVKEELFDENSIFNIVGTACDGATEAIEAKERFMIGVQFHPELEQENLKLFETLVEASKKDNT